MTIQQQTQYVNKTAPPEAPIVNFSKSTLTIELPEESQDVIIQLCKCSKPKIIFTYSSCFHQFLITSEPQIIHNQNKLLVIKYPKIESGNYAVWYQNVNTDFGTFGDKSLTAEVNIQIFSSTEPFNANFAFKERNHLFTPSFPTLLSNDEHQQNHEKSSSLMGTQSMISTSDSNHNMLNVHTNDKHINISTQNKNENFSSNHQQFSQKISTRLSQQQQQNSTTSISLSLSPTLSSHNPYPSEFTPTTTDSEITDTRYQKKNNIHSNFHRLEQLEDEEAKKQFSSNSNSISPEKDLFSLENFEHCFKNIHLSFMDFSEDETRGEQKKCEFWSKERFNEQYERDFCDFNLDHKKEERSFESPRLPNKPFLTELPAFLFPPTQHTKVNTISTTTTTTSRHTPSTPPTNGRHGQPSAPSPQCSATLKTTINSSSSIPNFMPALQLNSKFNSIFSQSHNIHRPNSSVDNSPILEPLSSNSMADLFDDIILQPTIQPIGMMMMHKTTQQKQQRLSVSDQVLPPPPPTSLPPHHQHRHHHYQSRSAPCSSKLIATPAPTFSAMHNAHNMHPPPMSLLPSVYISNHYDGQTVLPTPEQSSTFYNRPQQHALHFLPKSDAVSSHSAYHKNLKHFNHYHKPTTSSFSGSSTLPLLRNNVNLLPNSMKTNIPSNSDPNYMMPHDPQILTKAVGEKIQKTGFVPAGSKNIAQNEDTKLIGVDSQKKQQQPLLNLGTTTVTKTSSIVPPKSIGSTRVSSKRRGYLAASTKPTNVNNNAPIKKIATKVSYTKPTPKTNEGILITAHGKVMNDGPFFIIPNQCVGSFIGHRGEKINKIRRASGTHIDVDHFPLTDAFRYVHIGGKHVFREKAIPAVMAALRECDENADRFRMLVLATKKVNKKLLERYEIKHKCSVVFHENVSEVAAGFREWELFGEIESCTGFMMDIFKHLY